MTAPSKTSPQPSARVLKWASMCAVLALAAGCASEPYNRPYSSPGSYSPAGSYQVGQPYTVNGVRYEPREDWDYDQTGIASLYGEASHGRTTANGEAFDMHALTAAHPTLPMPTQVRVTNLENGRSIIVRINDRGPFKEGQIIGLSLRGAQELGFDRKGSTRVRVTMLGKAPLGRISESPPPAANTSPLPAPSPSVSQDGTAPVEPVVAEPMPLYQSLRNTTGNRGEPTEPLPILSHGASDQRRYAATEDLMAETVRPDPIAPPISRTQYPTDSRTEPLAPTPPRATPRSRQPDQAVVTMGNRPRIQGERRRTFTVWPPTTKRYQPAPPAESDRRNVVSRPEPTAPGSRTVRDWPLGEPSQQAPQTSRAQRAVDVRAPVEPSPPPVETRAQPQAQPASPPRQLTTTSTPAAASALTTPAVSNFRPYYYQVGAYGVKSNASTQAALLSSELNAALGTVEVRQTSGSSRIFHRVVVGPVRSDEAGAALKARLTALGFRDAMRVSR